MKKFLAQDYTQITLEPEEFTKIYTKQLRGVIAKKMRRPTMGEIKMFDREMHCRIYETMMRAPEASLAEGLVWFLEHKEHQVWRLMDYRVQSLPDQSVETLDGVQTEPQSSRKRGRECQIPPT